MTHPALATMVEAAKAAYRAGYVNGACCFIGEGEDDLRIGSEQSWNIHQEELLALPDTLSLDEYVRGLEEALKPFAAYQAAVAGRQPNFVELGYYADDITVELTAQSFRNAAAALGGKP